MRRAWLLIAGAEAPYFWLIGAVLKNPLLPSRAREDETLFNSPPVWPIAQPYLVMIYLTGSIATPWF